MKGKIRGIGGEGEKNQERRTCILPTNCNMDVRMLVERGERDTQRLGLFVGLDAGRDADNVLQLPLLDKLGNPVHSKCSS